MKKSLTAFSIFLASTFIVIFLIAINNSSQLFFYKHVTSNLQEKKANATSINVPASCTGVSGPNDVMVDSNNSYTVSVQGDAPITYSWSIPPDPTLGTLTNIDTQTVTYTAPSSAASYPLQISLNILVTNILNATGSTCNIAINVYPKLGTIKSKIYEIDKCDGTYNGKKLLKENIDVFLFSTDSVWNKRITTSRTTNVGQMNFDQVPISSSSNYEMKVSDNVLGDKFFAACLLVSQDWTKAGTFNINSTSLSLSNSDVTLKDLYVYKTHYFTSDKKWISINQGNFTASDNGSDLTIVGDGAAIDKLIFSYGSTFVKGGKLILKDGSIGPAIVDGAVYKFDNYEDKVAVGKVIEEVNKYNGSNVDKKPCNNVNNPASFDTTKKILKLQSGSGTCDVTLKKTTPDLPNNFDVIFVSGNLTIERDILIDGSDYVILVVAGNIDVANNVETINASIFTKGKFLSRK